MPQAPAVCIEYSPSSLMLFDSCMKNTSAMVRLGLSHSRMGLPASHACSGTAWPFIVPPSISYTIHPAAVTMLQTASNITLYKQHNQRSLFGCQKHICAAAAEQEQAEMAVTDAAAAFTPQATDGVLLLGFPLEDLSLIHANLEVLFPEVDPACIGVVTQPMARQPVSSLVSNITSVSNFLDMHMSDDDSFATSMCQDEASSDMAGSNSSSADQSLCPNRVVYLFGEAASAAGAFVNDLLVQMSVAPCIVGCLQPRHADMRLSDVCDSLRASHARYWDLVRPMAMSAPVDQLLQSYQQAQQQHTDAELSQHVLSPLASTTVTLAVVMDAGEVPSSAGGWRRDEAHLVVLDDLVTEQERQELLDWLTEPGHDHSGPPPDSKWEQACVDREGAAPSWGLKQHVLQQLETDPPSVMLAIQTRLAALYPEYTLCHMPADVLSTSDEEGSLSSFVGNAVLYGDPCAWHDDADPAILPPSSPWVHCYGYYYNREPGKPRFVTGLLYLNDAWAEELHAETMFLDPSTQTGVFTRPSPGRVILMDQDISHRICSPSKEAGARPRYSLVWKMVWLQGNDPTLPGEKQPNSHQEQGRTECAPSGLCRPEWGSPLRIGSTNEASGKPAWQTN